MLEQAFEEFAGLVLEIHPNAGPAQLTAVNVQFEHTEPNDTTRLGRRGSHDNAPDSMLPERR